jgi:hypothetical protein
MKIVREGIPICNHLIGYGCGGGKKMLETNPYDPSIVWEPGEWGKHV